MKLQKVILLCSLSGLLQAQTPEFDAKGILYFQDGDFNSDSYFTKKVSKAGTDWVGAFTFPLKFNEAQRPSEQSISNSAIDNHRISAIRNDKKIAYVLETRGILDKNARDVSLDNLPFGGFVSVLSIGNLQNLRPEYRFPVSNNPTAISLDYSNKYLSISTSYPGGEIQIFELDNLGKPLRLLPKIFNLEPGVVTDVLWHPTKDYLVFLKKDTKELGVVRIVKDKNTIIRLEQFGDVVKFEGQPTSAVFSKDGKNLFVLDKGDPETGVNGKVFLVKLSFETDGNHVLMSKADVEENPSYITLHPNGENLIVTNTQSSFKPTSLAKSSLSVLSFKNGVFENKLNYPIDGILPSEVTFDKTGRNFALSCFQTKAFGKPIGNITFYKFTAGNAPKIEKQEALINIPSGVHKVEVIN